VAGKRNNIASLHERPDPHNLGKEKITNKKSKPNTSLNFEKEKT